MSVEKSTTILVGKEEICKYAGFGKNMFLELLQRGFPAVFWGGKWRAHAENVEVWTKASTIPNSPQEDRDDD